MPNEIAENPHQARIDEFQNMEGIGLWLKKATLHPRNDITWKLMPVVHDRPRRPDAALPLITHEGPKGMREALESMTERARVEQSSLMDDANTYFRI